MQKYTEKKKMTGKSKIAEKHVEVDGYAYKDHIGMHRMQAAQLQYDKG